MQMFLLTLLTVILATDCYVFFTLVRGAALWLALLYWLPLALMVGSFIIFTQTSSMPAMYVFLALFLSTVLPKFVFTVASLLGRLAGLACGHNAVGVGNGIGGMLATVVFVSAVVGLAWGWRHLVVKEIEVRSADLPEGLDGFRVVQLADLHLGTYLLAPGMVTQIVERVNNLNADVIVFTGDIVNTSPEEMRPFVRELSTLKSRHGVFSIMGNHDYCPYLRAKKPEERAAAIKALQDIEREMGWTLLLNENRVLRQGSDSLAIVGVENDGNPPFPQCADLSRAMAGLADGCFKVLLTHDPTHWRRAVLSKTDAQLTLSGHTHGMQLKLWGFSPSSWVYKEWGGVYEEAGRTLHVSTGTGGNMPFRLGAWPEIVVLTLRRP